MIYVVGDQQDLHFKQLFEILDIMGAPFVDRLEHVNFGRVNGMSTRKGEVKVGVIHLPKFTRRLYVYRTRVIVAVVSGRHPGCRKRCHAISDGPKS